MFKVLVYHAIKVAVLLIQFVCMMILSSVQQHYVEKEQNESIIAVVLTIYYVTRLSFDISGLLTPIISIIILKPVLDALKNASKLFTLCSKDNEEDNTEIANKSVETLRGSESTF